MAADFVAATGVTFPMLWDPTLESWRRYGIQRNSDFWLLDGNGNQIGERFYRLDVSYIEELLATAA